MENAKSLNPSESLDIISRAIQQTKDNIKNQSFYFILWGWTIALASLGNYLLLTLSDFQYPYVTWYIFVPIGWIVSITYGIKSEKITPYVSYIDVFLKYLWVVLGVSFVGSVFISLTLKVDPSVFVLFLAGIGTLVTGLTMKFRPIIIGGIVFFLSAFASVYLSPSLTLLITSISVIIGYLIPAYMLKNSK